MENGFTGYFEGIRDDGWATGWVLRTGTDTAKVTVAIAVDGAVVGLIDADQFREDLLLADLRDPGCAFLFRLPDGLTDGIEHRIDITLADSGEALPNSPQQFVLAAPPADLALYANLVPNAGFAHWPSGAFVVPTGRMQEGPRNWLIDFWKGVSPGVQLSVDRPPELALEPGSFALRLTVPEPIRGYLRLIVPLDKSALTARRYNVGFGLRRTAGGARGDLYLAEAFVGMVNGPTVTKLLTVRRNLRSKGTTRVEQLPVVIDEAMAVRFDGEARPALVFEFQGSGELLLFDPNFSVVPATRVAATDVPGTFEDKAIQDQLALLKLSPLWGASGHPAATQAATQAAIPAARRQVTAHPFVQIVVPIFNAGADVDELLASLLEHTTGPFEILLADDGSGAFTAARLDSWAARDPRIKVVSNVANLGYTRNINRALQATVAGHLVLLNSDTLVTEGWLDRLMEVMAAADNIAAVGPLSNAASWQSVPQARTAAGKWSVNPLSAGVTVAAMARNVADLADAAFPEVPLLNGFCTLFRRDALEAVGWFDDATFPEGYGEENDLCLRLGRAGWSLRVADHAYVYHKKSRSFGPARRTALAGGASTALRAKHPDIAIDRIEDAMRSCAPINRLRARLRDTQFVELAA